MMQTNYQTSANAALHFLAFTMGDDEYGVSLDNVEEIHGSAAARHISDSLGAYTGGIQSRGKAMPAVDVCIKLNSRAETTRLRPLLLILNTQTKRVGMVVDKVSGVVTLDESQIRPTHEYAGPIANQDYITGIGTLDDRLLHLLNMEELVSSKSINGN